ncbi:class I SAM-dependent methyltransferase [Sandarakinorhabdus glacialis]|nr:class I SAM-dependent methyltransferase [Polymorphobacter glacialis]
MNAIDQSYSAKPSHYFSGARHSLVAQLPHAPGATILEIGCGSGGTGALALETGKCGRYYGIEIEPVAAARAGAVLTEVLVGNVEIMKLPYEESSLDVIIISEVLEHLVDPWAVVARLVKLLKPSGIMVATSPNISHWRVIGALFTGRFDYSEIGVMDRTHLRWFTPASFRRMFTEAGFVVDRVGPSGGFGKAARTINLVTGGASEHLFCTQIALFGHRPA